MNNPHPPESPPDSDQVDSVPADFSGILLDPSLLDVLEESVAEAATASHILGDRIRAWRSGL